MNTTHQSTHKLITGPAQQMDAVADNSIALVVTSPPYPMIAMWDDIFSKQNQKIGNALSDNDGQKAFELMNQELDKVWKEVDRVLMPGGFACINIGDATRTIDGNFSLYASHARIIQAFVGMGMDNLPNIIWRKQTNAPNKFMGSGMLPSGAYVTLEHEWVLVFRKGGKRKFTTIEGKKHRQESAFFWNERNMWFSDLWDLKGTRQNIKKSETRKRSAAYPFLIPYRLIQMYSLYGDTVLDPFLGTGTTTMAAIASHRSSIAYDIDEAFITSASETISDLSIEFYNELIESRIDRQKEFLINREANPKKSKPKYHNENLDMAIMTKQELQMQFYDVESISRTEDGFRSFHRLKNA